MTTWVEISADFECNNACLGCFSVQPGGRSMSTDEAVDFLKLGRRQGATRFWFGGGEPTLRRDIIKIVKASRLLGYDTVKLETNGMRLAYPSFVQRLVDVGLTEVNFAIKGPDAETHDRLTRTPGCFDAMMLGLDNAAAAGLSVGADVLVYRSNAPRLPELVRIFHERGVDRFNLWLLSAIDRADDDVVAELPRISEVMPHITAASDLGLSERDDFITSLHTPPCTVPAGYERLLFHAPDLELIVCNPGGDWFPLESSPIEGGVYFDGCAECVFRARCGGARADYVARYGDSEFRPVRDAPRVKERVGLPAI